MKTIIAAAALSALFVSTAVLADDLAEDKADVQADVGAIHKDNKVIAKHRSHVESRRASKAANKADNNYGGQAADSVAIGAEKTVIGAKKVERHVDRKILEHNENEVERESNQ